MGTPSHKNAKRRWYDRRSNDKWAQHVAEDPWRQYIVDQLDDLRRALLIRYLVLVAILVAVGVWVAVTRSQQASNQRTNTVALCAFRNDLQKRVDQGSDFLKAHPNGIPGLSAATIQVGIKNEQASIQTLQIIHCPKPKSK